MRSYAWATLSTALALCALCTPAACAAQQLDWNAPAGCPTQDAVLASIARFSDGSRAAGEPNTLEIHIRLERANEREFVAHVRMSGMLAAERDLTGDSCEAVAEASAWLIARVLAGASQLTDKPAAKRASGSGSETASETETETESVPEPEPEPASEPVPETAPEPETATPEPEIPPRFELLIGATADSASLPAWAIAPHAEFAFHVERFRLAARPRVFIPQRAGVNTAEVPDARATLGLAELALEVCYEYRVPHFGLGPCLAVAPGVAWGKGRNVVNARSALGGWLALEAGIAGEWRRGALAVRAQLALARPLMLPDFTLGEHTDVHSAALMVLRTGLAIGVLF